MNPFLRLTFSYFQLILIALKGNMFELLTSSRPSGEKYPVPDPVLMLHVVLA